MRKFAFLLLYLLLCCASIVWADFYRYVDRDGREFFVNDAKQVPQEYRSTATVLTPDTDRVRVADESPGPVKARASVKEHTDKYGRGELYWRKRADKLRKQLRTLQDKHDLLVEQEKTEAEQPRKLRSKKNKSLAKSKAQLERKIALKKRELDVDLPEEARRADAYPGWLRE